MKNILIIFILIISILTVNSCTQNRDSNCTKNIDPNKEIIDKKPALYLYPRKKQKIDVSLQINGLLITSIPTYNKDGWHVNVDKNGIIENKYDYLFYENSLKSIELPTDGWIKEYKELNSWFDNILAKLGLNQKEKNQFKEYWLKELRENKFYEIKLLSENFINKNITLNINPKPDSIIRVHLHFKVIEKKYKLNEPFISTPRRFGFSVVEWGGIVKE